MIVFVRHGETELNRRHVLQGRSDTPLNDRGRQQAAEAGETLRRLGLRFDRVYTSPLCRAAETARIIAPEVEPIADARLLEMDYGPYEGGSLTPPAPELAAFFRDFAHTPAPAGMESLASVTARLGDFLDSLDAGEGENILISTHAIAMKGALEYLTPGSDGAWWSRYLKNCALFVCRPVPGGYTVPEELTGVE